MTAAGLMAELARRGVRLEAAGDSLRFFPREAVSPELLAALRACKPELLALLRPDEPIASTETTKPIPPEATPPRLAARVCRCGSLTWRDIALRYAPHNGETVRRDCAHCRRFLDFPRWYGHGN